MRALVLAGPTGAGKTDLSLEIALHFFPSLFEIISADSVQVYRYLDIGSGKLPPDKRAAVPHFLIDEVLPDFHFDMAEFCARSERYCAEIASRGKIPLFVGGTGLYIDSFFKGLSPVPEIDPSVRKSLEEEILQKGLPNLYKELESVDKDSSLRIHPNDRQRILRALQVFRGTGIPLSEYRNRRVGRESEKTLYVGLGCEREELDRRIEKRVDVMIELGFVDEVVKLRDMGYGSQFNSMKSIGYFELGRYLDRVISFEESVLDIKRETKEYARKQMTWFKRNKSVKWFSGSEITCIIDAISAWLAECEYKKALSG